MSLWNFRKSREFTLTMRRKQALIYAAAGFGIKEFCAREGIAYDTGRAHLRYARFVYNAPTVTAAVFRAMASNDISVEEVQALDPLQMTEYYE